MTSQLGQEAPVARATARFVRVTPMKARRVVDLVRYLPTDEALALLRFARRETGQTGPATQQQGNQARGSQARSNTRGGTR